MLHVSSSPHIRDPRTTTHIMRDVVIALLPAVVAAVIFFGYRSLLLIAVTVAACLLFEYLSRRLMKRENTIGDFSAVVTGILLAFNFPVTLPYWMAILGAFIAIVMVKQMFGGLGENFANPALAARIILAISFPAQMTNMVIKGIWVGKDTVDLVASATPMAALRAAEEAPNLLHLFLGLKSGVIGEVSGLALLLGAVYLLLRGVIDLWIPVPYIATTLIFVALAGHDPLVHLFSGGLFLAAFFMANDYVTSPITAKGKIIFGIGAGLLTGLIRIFGSAPEGVSFAILLMNLLTPHIDAISKNQTIGGVKHVKR